MGPWLALITLWVLWLKAVLWGAQCALHTFQGLWLHPFFFSTYRNIRAVIVKPHSMLNIRLEYFIEQGIQQRKHGWSKLPNLRPQLRELVNGISQTAISGSIEWNIQWKSHEHHLFTRPSKNIHLKSENKESLEFCLLSKFPTCGMRWEHNYDEFTPQLFLQFSTFYKIMMSPSHSRGHFLHPSPSEWDKAPCAAQASPLSL